MVLCHSFPVVNFEVWIMATSSILQDEALGWLYGFNLLVIWNFQLGYNIRSVILPEICLLTCFSYLYDLVYDYSSLFCNCYVSGNFIIIYHEPYPFDASSFLEIEKIQDGLFVQFQVYFSDCHGFVN